MAPRSGATTNGPSNNGPKRPTANKSKINAGYRHIDKDPIIDVLVSRFRDSALSYDRWAWLAGLSPTTVRNWDSGATRSPQYRSVVRAALALDLEFGLHKHGKVKEQSRIPSTTYYEGDILRWQHDHKGAEPDATIPVRGKAS